MTRTVTAMFESRSDAEAARDRLSAAGISSSNVQILDQSSSGYSADTYSTATHENRGVWASIKNAFMPDEDRHTFEEGIRRGHYVLSADVDENEADRAVAALEESSSIDIDQASAGWRAGGWTGGSYGSAPDSTTGYGSTTTGGDTGMGTTGTYGRDDMTGNEQRIPVVEEQLVVGKREVNRGGVRVRSYVVETPVSEQVRLRQENVSVERRAVNEPMSSVGEDAFRERTINMTETSEEAVVGKTARVVEEVVVRKDAGERTETVSDSVRRTEVEVDRDAGTKTGTSGYGTTGSGTGVAGAARGVADKVEAGFDKLTGKTDRSY